MATKKKLNVKFLALVLGALAVGLAVVGGIVLVQYRNDPVKHIRKGDELIAEGRPDKAVREYLRGIGKAPFEMGYYDKAIAAIETIQPQTDFEAMEEFNRLMGVLLAKAEKASPQDGRTAGEVRTETLARVLDEIRIFVWGREIEDLSIRDRAYSELGRRFQLVDAAMSRVLPADRDARMAAAVRGVTLEAAWRAGLLQTDSQWSDTEARLRKAIELDPTYVPNWYGLLRGQLDRIGRTLVESGPRGAARLLDAEGGFRETLTNAREAIGASPAPEIDLLEVELGQIAFYAGFSGSDDEDLVPDPDPSAVVAVVDAVDVLAELPEWEGRARLEELRAAGIGMLRRTPSARIDARELGDWRDRAVGLLDAASDAIVSIDSNDGRAVLLQLSTLDADDRDDPAARKRMDRMLAAAGSATMTKVGLESLVVPTMRRKAARTVFDLALGAAIDKLGTDVSLEPEDVTAIEDGLASVESAFGGAAGDTPPAAVLQCRLMLAAYLGLEATKRGDDVAAAGHFRDGSRAANQLRQASDAVLDGRTLDAALIVAEARGEFGEAVDLYSRAIASNPEVASDLAIRLRFVDLLVKAARLDEASGLIPEIKAKASAEGDAVTLAKLEKLERGIRQVDEGVDLSEVRGADLLASETEAALRGDLDERRRLLDQVIDDPEVIPAIRAKALLRRASIEATEGDFGIAREYAGRVLEIEPENSMARLMMQANADTGLLERFRLLAENATEDPEDRDVAVAGMIRSQLFGDGAALLEERAAMQAEYDRIVASLKDAADPGVEALRFLTELALAEGRLEEANDLVSRLVALESTTTSPTVLLQSRILEAGGRLEEAIAFVREAIERQGLGTDGMQVVLGDLLTSRGERDAAREAYQAAFQQAPTRPINALRLANALLAEGRGQEALPVLRAARSAGRENPSYLDRWLLQEMRAGNHDVAIRERRRRYAFAPTDFRNASALVVLLMESPIGRNDIVWTEADIRGSGARGAEVGTPRFDDVSWSRLTAADRQQVVLAVREGRSNEAGSIIERMLELDGSDPQVVVAATGFLQARNAESGAETAKTLVNDTVSELRSAIADMAEDESRISFELRLARLLALQGELALRSRATEEAARLFEEAATVEGDRSSDVDTLIASAYQRQGMLPQSVPFQARLLSEREASGTPLAVRREIARRLVELYVATDDLKGAEPIVAKYFRGADPTVADLVSVAAYTFGRADEARRQRTGPDDLRYLTLLDESMALYDRALALRAEDYTIDFTRAKIAEYRWRWAEDEDRVRLYTDLRNLVSQIASRHADNWSARRNLVEVLLFPDGGDSTDTESGGQRFKEAMAQIRGFLELDPSHVEARKLLIDSLAARGEPRQALDVAQASLDADPTNRDWSARVGRLRTELKEFDEAARQFGLLFQQTGDPSFLQMQTMALMERDPPAADAVIDLARANGGLFARQPFLAGMYAAAMAQTGRRDLALRNFESTYRDVLRKASAPELSPEQGWRSRGFISAPLPKLFPATEDGVRDLEAYLDTISGGRPGLSDLLAVGGAWQTVIDNEVQDAELRGRAVDEALTERATRAAADVMRRATSVEPEHPETFVAFLRLGILMQSLDDCDGSLEAFEQCVQLRPEAPEAKNNLAYLLRECDRDLDQALQLVSEAVAARPASPEFRDTHGAILLALADRESDAERQASLRQQARDELVQAARLGTSPAPLIRLAELEIGIGRADATRSALSRAGDRSPDAAQQARIDELIAALGRAG